MDIIELPLIIKSSKKASLNELLWIKEMLDQAQELVNLAAEMPEIIDELKQKLDIKAFASDIDITFKKDFISMAKNLGFTERPKCM